jgi:hypothetical protein
MNDVSTPRFSEIREAGGIVLNPFNSEEIAFDCGLRDRFIPARVVVESADVDVVALGSNQSTPESWPGADWSWRPKNLFPSSLPGVPLMPYDEHKNLGRMATGYKFKGSLTTQKVSRWSREVQLELEQMFNAPNLTSIALSHGYASSSVAASSLEAVYDKINDSELELATEFMEFPETVMMLYHTVKRFYEFIKLLRQPAGLRKFASRLWRQQKRRLRRKLKRHPSNKEIARELLLNHFSDVWLEARYGWRPIYIQAKQIMDGLHFDRPPRKTFRATRSAGESYRNSRGNWTVTEKGSSGAICSAANLSFSSVAGCNNLVTMGLEILPYSFVVGWFVNISAIASSLNPSPIYESLGSWTVHTVTTDFNVVVYDPWTDTPLLRELFPDPIVVSGTHTLKDRVIYPSRQFFQLDLKLTGKYALNLVDLALLIRQVANR